METAVQTQLVPVGETPRAQLPLLGEMGLFQREASSTLYMDDKENGVPACH